MAVEALFQCVLQFFLIYVILFVGLMILGMRSYDYPILEVPLCFAVVFIEV